MTLRERIETVFRGGTPDAMAWFGDLTYWHGAHAKLGDLPERWSGARGIGRLHRDYHVGEYVPGYRAYRCFEGERVRCEVNGGAASGGEERSSCEVEAGSGVKTCVWTTPVGTLTERLEYSAPSMSWGVVEHAVKDVADLRVLRYLMENRRYEACPEEHSRVDRDYGDFGLPIAAVPGSPVTELNKSWAGVMGLCYLMADERGEVEKTLAAIAESQERLMRLTEDSPANYVMICENLSGDTMGGYFDDYMRDYLTRLADRLRSHGKKTLIHIDGALRGALDKIAVTGIDCVDAVTPKPVGDVFLEDLRAMAGPDILLLGGIPGAMFAPPFGPAQMEAHVKKLIKLHKDSGKFMLGVADQVPPNGDIGLVKLIGELVEEHGRY